MILRLTLSLLLAGISFSTTGYAMDHPDLNPETRTRLTALWAQAQAEAEEKCAKYMTDLNAISTKYSADMDDLNAFMNSLKGKPAAEQARLIAEYKAAQR